MTDFLLFVLLYSFLKLVRIMIAGTVLMTAAFFVCQAGGYRSWRQKLAALALVPLACLTGYSRIFYTGKLLLYTNRIQELLTKEMAVCYFGIAAVLAVRCFSVHRCLRRRLKRMQRMDTETYIPELSRRIHKMHIQVYLTEEQCSPFAGGFVRPYIVMPEHLQKELSREEFCAVLYHETVHISHGHVFLLSVYTLLKILWWIHPLVYILDDKLRQYIEYSSDEASVMLGPLGVQEYAGVILKTVKLEQRRYSRESITAFSEGCFAVLKKRIERLGMLQDTCRRNKKEACRQYKKKQRYNMAGTAAAAACGAAVLLAASLPRYTVLKEISVYDENLRPLTFDMEAEGVRAEAAPDAFFISSREMEKLVSKYRLTGKYVFFSYDTIMKVPGTGGLGQAARVSVKDASDVFMLGRREWTDQMKTFILKYLI